MATMFFIGITPILIDDCDADLLQHSWHLAKRGSSYRLYVQRSTSRKPHRTTESLHRVILSRVLERPLSQNEDVDHVDLDTTNNTRGNLRLATRSQNRANTAKPKTNTTGYKGVFRVGNRYKSQIQANKKMHYLGCFATPEEAHAAYMETAKLYYGEFARGE